MTDVSGGDFADLMALIRTVPDFPVPGIQFRDITPLLFDATARTRAVEAMAEAARALEPEVIAGIESRGFIFGIPVAERLGLPFVPVRKAGKLPHDVAIAHYDLEYGTATLEMHRTPSVAGLRVVVDDLLATGGTASAAARLVEEVGGTVVGFVFLIGLDALDGQAALGGREVRSILAY